MRTIGSFGIQHGFGGLLFARARREVAVAAVLVECISDLVVKALFQRAPYARAATSICIFFCSDSVVILGVIANLGPRASADAVISKT